MKSLIYLSFLFLGIITSCKNTQQGSVKNSTEKADFETIAQQKFNKPYTKLYNASGTHVVCYVVDKKTQQNPVERLQLMVFNAKTNELIYEKIKANAQVKWLTDKRIQISAPSGNGESPGVNEVYDVEKRKKVKVNADL